MSAGNPWERVKNPLDLPRFDHAGDLGALDDATFTDIVRDHLLPRSDAGRYKSQWTRFWNVIALDPALSDRAEKYLQAAIADTRTTIATDELSPAQAKRAHAFVDRATMALDRLDRTAEEPLAWLGPRAAEFNPRARTVIDVLVHAIDQHRTDHDDGALYSVLLQLKLDPAQRTSRTEH